MDKDYVQGTGFKLLTYPVPCCGVHCTMHELVYDSAQGLGRFSLCAMNPNIGRLEERYRVEFEAILGTKLRVIYVHM